MLSGVNTNEVIMHAMTTSQYYHRAAKYSDIIIMNVMCACMIYAYIRHSTVKKILQNISACLVLCHVGCNVNRCTAKLIGTDQCHN